MKNGQPSKQNIQCDALKISIRAFVPPPIVKKFTRKPRKLEHRQSEWTLVFDTETKTDASQAMRFGVYHVYSGDTLHESGIFFDPEVLGNTEQSLLRAYAAAHSLRLITKAQFVDDVFYGVAYELRATVVGFNLPFDLSRVAIRHGSARGKTMRGGVSPFSFRRTHGSREYKSSICQPVLRLFNSRSHADDLTHAECERRATRYHRAVVPLSM